MHTYIPGHQPVYSRSARDAAMRDPSNALRDPYGLGIQSPGPGRQEPLGLPGRQEPVGLPGRRDPAHFTGMNGGTEQGRLCAAIYGRYVCSMYIYVVCVYVCSMYICL